MCRIRIIGPLSIHGTLLVLIALARTSCILEVLQIAASANAPHPNEIHCLRMERSGLLHFFSATRSLNPSIAQVKLVIATPVRILRAFLSCRRKANVHKTEC